MTFPILIEECDGRFAASLLGSPDVRVVRATRSQAIDSLKSETRQRIRPGELLILEIEGASVSDLAGKYSRDPTLRQICEDVYLARDSR